MNIQKARDIIKHYKRHFEDIHDKEIYKWRAVKCFQDNWEIKADDFPAMLDRSLHLAKNLLDSGQYFPKRMLLKNAKANPVFVRQLFTDLYDEDEDLIQRILNFQDGISRISNKRFPGKKDYQDHRAILVYLCLRYPDRYYLYKYTMFKEFVRLVDYPYQPPIGDIANILQYLTLCNILKEEILQDNQLLEFHEKRITNQEYLDSSFNILTQDVIYAAVRHLPKFKLDRIQKSALKRLVRVNKTVSTKPDSVVLKGSFTNYLDNERKKKRIGDLGELLVLQHEQEKLNSLRFNKAPEHRSKSQGDGWGYDILSYNEQGEEIYIEVKTTVGNHSTPFYITRNELEKSKQDGGKFFLYRLYDFDDTNNTAKYFIRQGSLIDLCVNPILYRISMKD